MIFAEQGVFLPLFWSFSEGRTFLATNPESQLKICCFRTAALPETNPASKNRGKWERRVADLRISKACRVRDGNFAESLTWVSVLQREIFI